MSDQPRPDEYRLREDLQREQANAEARRRAETTLQERVDHLRTQLDAGGPYAETRLDEAARCLAILRGDPSPHQTAAGIVLEARGTFAGEPPSKTPTLAPGVYIHPVDLPIPGGEDGLRRRLRELVRMARVFEKRRFRRSSAPVCSKSGAERPGSRGILCSCGYAVPVRDDGTVAPHHTDGVPTEEWRHLLERTGMLGDEKNAG